MPLPGSWETGTGSPNPVPVSQLPGKDTFSSTAALTHGQKLSFPVYVMKSYQALSSMME